MPMSSSRSSRSIGSDPPWVWQSIALAKTSSTTLVSCLSRSTRSSLTWTFRISDSGKLSSGLTLSRCSSGTYWLLPSDEATRAGLGEDVVVLDDDAAAQDGHSRHAVDLAALQSRPAALGIAPRGGDGVAAVEVD